MLEIKNFSKKYGDKEAVSHLSFVVNDGDIMGFVGKNGAGKTTTLKACMGIITITEGDILLDGISVVKEPIVCKRKMAYVPDTPRLEEYMTGMQYLNFVCDIYQISAKERKQNIERLIHAFQMEPHISGLISSYSHGMKQKVALIAAFSHNPKLLVLDEPFVGLDPEAFIALKEQMKMLCRKGSSILFSSHILDVVEKLCNIISIIKDALAIMVSLSCTTFPSISIEGKNMELIKSMPISIFEFIKAKLLFHLSLSIPITLVLNTALAFGLHLQWAAILSGYLLPLVFSAFIGVAGCIANLLFPSFDWENATYIVKRSIPAILNALMSMALSCGGFYILIKHFPKHLFIGNAVIILIVVGLTAAAILWLKEKGEILYRKL